jgi:hypothetical protein
MTVELKPTKRGVQLMPNAEAVEDLVCAIEAVSAGDVDKVVLDEIHSATEDPIVVSLSEYRGTLRLDIRHWYYPD